METTKPPSPPKAKLEEPPFKKGRRVRIIRTKKPDELPRELFSEGGGGFTHATPETEVITNVGDLGVVAQQVIGGIAVRLDKAPAPLALIYYSWPDALYCLEPVDGSEPKA